MRIIQVSEEWLAGILSEREAWTTFRCKRGLPPGARLLKIDHDPTYGLISLLFEHESFEEAGHPQAFAPLFEARVGLG